MGMDSSKHYLNRRESQIMDIVYRRGKASADEVLHDLPAPPSYSAVRATLAILERKGHIRHKREGRRYTFYPTTSAAQMRRSVLRHVLQTFFEGSVERAMVALVELSAARLSDEEIARLGSIIEEARKRGN